MEISVLIESVNGHGFRARGGEPFAMTAEGATREEALRNLREMIDKRLSNGAEVVRLEVTPGEHPLAKYIGTWSPDDPAIQEWKRAVEEYRRKADEDPDY